MGNTGKINEMKEAQEVTEKGWEKPWNKANEISQAVVDAVKFKYLYETVQCYGEVDEETKQYYMRDDTHYVWTYENPKGNYNIEIGDFYSHSDTRLLYRLSYRTDDPNNDVYIENRGEVWSSKVFDTMSHIINEVANNPHAYWRHNAPLKRK